jgi:hypothetical protein
VWVLLRSVRETARNVVSHDRPRESEVGGGTVWEVTDDKSVRLTARLPQQNEVRHAVRPTRVNETTQLVTSSVDSLAVRNEQTNLL